MSDWPIGLSTGCFYQTGILDCLELVRTAGFGMIEICSYPRHLDYHDTDAVVRAAERLRQLGLEPYSFHAPFADHIDITTSDSAGRQQAIKEILQAAQAAATLGVRYLVIHPGPEKGGIPEEERPRRMENAVSVLNQISSRCVELGLGFVLENMLPHLFAGHVRDLLWIMGSLESISVGLCLDTGHAHLSGDLRNVAHKLSGHLWMVHANDNSGSRDDHLPPGDGQIEWEPLLSQLSVVGFRGAFILEIAGHEDPRVVLEDARRGRAYLRDVSRRLRRHAYE